MATTKQKAAIAHIIEGDSVSKAMRKAGYTAASAKNPKALTERKGFIEFMEVYGITDEKLAKKLDEGLEATDPKGHADFTNRHRYLETSLRLKGHSKEQSPNIVVVPIYAGRSTE